MLVGGSVMVVAMWLGSIVYRLVVWMVRGGERA